MFRKKPLTEQGRRAEGYTCPPALPSMADGYLGPSAPASPGNILGDHWHRAQPVIQGKGEEAASQPLLPSPSYHTAAGLAQSDSFQRGPAGLPSKALGVVMLCPKRQINSWRHSSLQELLPFQKAAQTPRSDGGTPAPSAALNEALVQRSASCRALALSKGAPSRARSGSRALSLQVLRAAAAAKGLHSSLSRDPALTGLILFLGLCFLLLGIGSEIQEH